MLPPSAGRFRVGIESGYALRRNTGGIPLATHELTTRGADGSFGTLLELVGRSSAEAHSPSPSGVHMSFGAFQRTVSRSAASTDKCRWKGGWGLGTIHNL
jgi:hypothetical protein